MKNQLKKKNKVCFIVVWLGKLPEYMPIWIQTIEKNKNFDFLLFTDDPNVYSLKISENLIIREVTLSSFITKAQEVLNTTVNIERAYRLCDFRPMFGLIFSEYLREYDFWGYCDLDLVFGDIGKFVTDQEISEYDAFFNGGHFTLIRNNSFMNNLYKENGAAFKFSTVVQHDAIFAFDEITGIQQIARYHGIKARYSIPYVDADVKYRQLRSVMDKVNPDNQAFYWEKGKLYRVKEENNSKFITEIAYIHLQKRPIIIKDKIEDFKNAFWIEPDGVSIKEKLGKPSKEEILKHNPFLGDTEMAKEKKEYRRRKIRQILSRNPYQIFVRIVQAFNGINRNQGNKEIIKWKKY